ncbi:MAG: DUF2062 domain-containing protein [Sulfurospirillum sp.]|nr:DUF2062 domain-containing protein [Sulfurospirillum sp.]MBL0703350.1 DUF2062 domain-containing protein [Sulfurospirillum sp.]
MIRKIFNKNSKNNSKKINKFIKKHKIPREYLSINRKSITRGLALGVFWAFIPMPMQMLAIVFSTLIFRFNVPVALGTVWLSNPVTMPFIYYIEYMTGNFLLGGDTLDIELTTKWFSAHIDAVLIPLYVGTFFYSTIVSTLIYYSSNWLWINSVKKEKRHQKRKNNKNKKSGGL